MNLKNMIRALKIIAVIAFTLYLLVNMTQKSKWKKFTFKLPETDLRKPIPFITKFSAPPKNLSWEATQLLEALNGEKVAQDDRQLVKLIRTYFIFPPSKEPYRLQYPNMVDYSKGQTPFIDSRLDYMESGFYVECGAFDGEQSSNTLFLERVRKWNGLLIEADPEIFKELISKNRKALAMNACLNPYGYPAKIKFNRADQRGRLMHDNRSLEWIKGKRLPEKFINVQCFPFYSILLALNQTRVDFFSLDIEGDELSVLKTIPWDKVDIRMLTVEYLHQKGKHRELQKYMESVGYATILKMDRDDHYVNDLIFQKTVQTS